MENQRVCVCCDEGYVPDQPSLLPLIDILYQSQHLLHRFFQFEPTTKTPPLSEILEPLI